MKNTAVNIKKEKKKDRHLHKLLSITQAIQSMILSFNQFIPVYNISEHKKIESSQHCAKHSQNLSKKKI